MYRRTSDRARPYQVAPQPVFPERHCDRLHVEDGGVERWREAAWRGHAEIFGVILQLCKSYMMLILC